MTQQINEVEWTRRLEAAERDSREAREDAAAELAARGAELAVAERVAREAREAERGLRARLESVERWV